MPAVHDTDPLVTALAELSALGGERERAEVAVLHGRLRERRLRVLVAGEAKRGKSTLVNALLGRAVLPAGVTPLTALATTVRYGRDEGVTAVYRDGRSQACPLSALHELVTERGNPGNRLGLASVTVAVDAPVLARGVELVDTPGTGSVHEHNTAEAETALETMDAAVFVLTADPPVSASERDLMARVAALSVTMFVVLNKADYLAVRPGAAGRQGGGPGAGGLHGDTGDLAEAVEFAARVTGEATGRPLRVYPVSARAALAGEGEPGFAAFTGDFGRYLETERVADVRVSVAGHACRLAGDLRDEVDLARRAARMRGGEAAARVAAFSERLAAVTGRRQDAVDLAEAECARMLVDLNEAARQAGREVTAAVATEMEALLRGGLRSAPASRIEADGRAWLGRRAVAGAEHWREEQTRRLEAGLAQLDERLTGGLRAELDAVRDAAAELLGLTLFVAGPGDRLVPDLSFFYLVAADAGQTELLAGVIRRHLPGEAGRRRARACLRREAAWLVPQQIGRARADLQYRLAEASRRLGRLVEARYTDSTARLENALLAAAAIRQATAAQAARRDGELAGRRAALERVAASLGEAVADRARGDRACGDRGPLSGTAGVRPPGTPGRPPTRGPVPPRRHAADPRSR